MEKCPGETQGGVQDVKGGVRALTRTGSLLDLPLGCGGCRGSALLRVWPEPLDKLGPVLKQRERGFGLDTFV